MTPSSLANRFAFFFRLVVAHLFPLQITNAAKPIAVIAFCKHLKFMVISQALGIPIVHLRLENVQDFYVNQMDREGVQRYNKKPLLDETTYALGKYNALAKLLVSAKNMLQ